MPGSGESLTECLLHMQGMILNPDLPDGQNHAAAEMRMELLADGRPVAAVTHYFRYHDWYVQLLEDVWCRFPMDSAISTIALKNCNATYPLFLSRITVEAKTTDHLQLTVPEWALAGERITGKVFALRAGQVEAEYDGQSQRLETIPGWNEFQFRVMHPGLDLKVAVSDGIRRREASIGAVYALNDEMPEVTVGYDMTVVPHDEHGFMDWLLDYTSRTRLGNTVVFRNFRPHWKSSALPAEASLARWGALCRRRRIHVQSVNCHSVDSEKTCLLYADGRGHHIQCASRRGDATLQLNAGEYMHNAGKHEFPGVVYALDPETGAESADMKEAYDRYIAFLKADVDQVKAAGLRPAYGDASGGHRHCYLAGASFIRSETMVPHTQHICSLARPAAEALGQGDWGVHIAIQHTVQPYQRDPHLGQFFLSMMQPWMMGASMIYEEDSLFLMFKEERQCWDDALTKGKRDMMREFFRFVKTHPRSGQPRRTIAFLEGRYAAPFNGFICGPEQTPHYSVWGKFCNNDPAWGHGQPEKCRHLLDVLMPGASVHPLRQRFDKRRFFFSGTPNGDFDQVPIEADNAYFTRYKLLLNLGWNTILGDDYRKLKDFVAQGGTLLTGIPQFSTHVKRDFLKDMNDLALWNNGDLSELCGVKIIGKGDIYSGQWMAKDRNTFVEPELSRIPNDSPDEDGDCHLAHIELGDAEVMAWDACSGAPLLVRHRFGQGMVYLLCAWAYPGHESLSSIVAAWLNRLAEQCRDEWHVDDHSREVFWNSWRDSDSCGRMMLLNTDWTVPGNVKHVTVHTPAVAFSATVTEREAKIITVLPWAALEPSSNMHIEVVCCSEHSATLRLHGAGHGSVRVHGQPSRSVEIDFAGSTVQELELHRASTASVLLEVPLPVGRKEGQP